MLRRYDPQTGSTERRDAAPVPEDWSGEPKDYHFTWPDLHEAAEDEVLNAELAGTIRRLIENGDKAYLVDADGQRTHEFFVQGDLVDWRPLGGS